MNVSFINSGERTHNSDLGNFKNGSYGVKAAIYGFISRHKILLFINGKIRQTEKSVMMQCFSGFFSRVAHHRISVRKISGEKPDIFNSVPDFFLC